jgi:hypothetical protein
MVRVLQGIPIFTSRPISLVSLFWSCTLVEIELMISLFSLFEVMEPQGNYMEELYNQSTCKLTWMLCCYLSCIARLFYIYQTCIFCNSHEMHFGTTGNSLLRKCVSINKIIMRLVKLCM